MPEFERVGLDPYFVDYRAGMEIQLKTHADVAANLRPNTVLLLEHKAVYTAGKRTEEHELPNDGSEFIETNRGGKINLARARATNWLPDNAPTSTN